MSIEHKGNGLNTVSTVNRCTQLTLLAGALGWVLTHYVPDLRPMPMAASIGAAQFMLVLFAMGLAPVVIVVMPTLYSDVQVRKTSFWFGIISATLLMSIATVLHFLIAAVGACACMVLICGFYFVKYLVMRAHAA